jgi:rod shape-determining protein MreB
VTFLSLPTGSFSRGLGIDLGTANTVLSRTGDQFVVSEPSLIAADALTGEPLAAGYEASELLGRTGIAGIRPLRRGVIADSRGTEAMLRHFIARMWQRRWSAPRVVASVPSGVTDVQRRAVIEACRAAGAREVRLIAKPIAAGLGTELPVLEPIGTMVLDIGYATSEVTLMSMGALVASKMIAVGGLAFDESIVAHVRRQHQALIGAQTAEEIKIQIGSVCPYDRTEIEILGSDMATRVLKAVRLTSHEIRVVLERPLVRIIAAIQETLACAPPQLACDVMDRGITLTGGSSLLRGLAARLCRETQMPARLAEAPCTCAAIGAARLLEGERVHSRSFARRTIAATTAAAAN